MGYLSRCMDSQRDVHHIPLDSSQSIKLVKGRSYGSIYRDIYEFVTRAGDDVPCLFCMGDDVEETSFGLEYLHDQARVEYVKLPELHPLVADLECLVTAYTQNHLSFAQCTDLLTKYSYDYSSNTRCEFHDEEGTVCCALALVKRKAYLISDAMCPMHNIQVTPLHLPVESSAGTMLQEDLNEFRFKYRQAANGRWSKRTSNRMNDEPRSGYEMSQDIRLLSYLYML